MKKIKSCFVANQFLPGIPIGWSFYPITYINDQYVVELRVVSNVPKVENLRVDCCIYEYGVENKLFKKHRRKRIFREPISVVSIEENKIINIERATENEIKMYTPQIIAYIFQQYELAKQHNKDISKKIAESKNWDGVIK